MTSSINPQNIDANYPVAGVPNNTQGFRDNFTNIQTNFTYAKNEITDLENKAVLKSALDGTTLDNNMGDQLIYSALIRDFSGSIVQNTVTSGAVALDYSSGHYQTVSTTGSITLGFSNFPTSGTVGMMRVQVNITNTSYTMTLPAAVTLGLTGIQGISGNVITFGATGYYEFGFVTSDGGTTITVFDLNRPLSYFTNTVNVAATTASTSTTTGALIVAGGAGIVGNVYGGNIRTAGLISATGNITGGNIINSGASSVTGNITGGNVLTGGLISATGNIAGGNLSVIGNISISTGAPVVYDTTGAFLSGRILGRYANRTGNTTNYYFADYNGSNSITSADATAVNQLGGTVSTTITNANISMAIGTSYGNKAAGLAFVSGTANDVLAMSANTAPSYTGNINAVMLGYPGAGPRILVQDYALTDDGPNVISYIGTTHSFVGAVTSTGNVKLLSGTAVPAGGTAGAGLLMSSTANLGVFFGSGAPTLTAAQGSLYLRTDGSSTSTRMYVNTSGSTTWTAVTTVA